MGESSEPVNPPIAITDAPPAGSSGAADWEPTSPVPPSRRPVVTVVPGAVCVRALVSRLART
ncbi:MAG TPA: hypothetical protein VFW65_25030 [Pseudonocardiaceae bacterium]|nr:hypothetical protein [Pseudonocardiaceae bacterium]